MHRFIILFKKVAFTPVVFLLGLGISQFSSIFGIFQESITRISQIDPVYSIIFKIFNLFS